MLRRQPDDRISRRDLRIWEFDGKKFIVNGRRGVPQNAVIEEFNGALRCWASKVWLDEEAAEEVRNIAEKTEGNAFVLKKRGNLWK